MRRYHLSNRFRTCFVEFKTRQEAVSYRKANRDNFKFGRIKEVLQMLPSEIKLETIYKYT